MKTMSMYVDLLSTALGDWANQMSQGALIAYAWSCREMIHNPGIYEASSNFELLAVEIAYDRALIRLCEVYDIEVELADFMYPHEARTRLELELALAGVTFDAADEDDVLPS